MDEDTFGSRLARARESAGANQEQVGEAAGVSKSAVSQWESNATRPNVVQAAEICKRLNVSADYLILGRKTLALPPEAKEVARAWLKLKEPRRGFWRDSLYLEAAVSQLYPWLALGKPEGDGYDAWERQVQRDMVERLCGIAPTPLAAPKKR